MANKCLTEMSFMFFIGFFSVAIKQAYDMDDARVGYIYLAMTVSYTVSCVIMPICFKRVPRRLMFVVGFYVDTVCLLYTSPSPRDRG